MASTFTLGPRTLQRVVNLGAGREVLHSLRCLAVLVEHVFRLRVNDVELEPICQMQLVLVSRGSVCRVGLGLFLERLIERAELLQLFLRAGSLLLALRLLGRELLRVAFGFRQPAADFAYLRLGSGLASQIRGRHFEILPIDGAGPFVQVVKRLLSLGDEVLKRLFLFLNLACLLRIFLGQRLAGLLAILFVLEFHLHLARVGELLDARLGVAHLVVGGHLEHALLVTLVEVIEEAADTLLQ